MYTREEITKLIEEKKAKKTPEKPDLMAIMEAYFEERIDQKVKEVIPKDGADGETPVKGVHYFDGENGKDGLNGENGRDGLDGVDGADGEDGEDGVSVTIEDVRPLLKELLGELDLGLPQKKVEDLLKKHSKAISDTFDSKLGNLRAHVDLNYGGHGGASTFTTNMEIPTGTVDSVNTVFTVTHTPLYIEVSGQLMVSSAQDATQYGYTLSGLTVTFVNAPTQTPHSFYNS